MASNSSSHRSQETRSTKSAWSSSGTEGKEGKEATWHIRLHKLKSEANVFHLDNFLDKLDIMTYKKIQNDIEKTLYIENFDTIDLYNAVNTLNERISQAKVENYSLQKFLEQNDPKLLVGLTGLRVRKGANLSLYSKGKDSLSLSHGKSTRSFQSLAPTGRSLMSSAVLSLTSRTPPAKEFRLNFLTKYNLIEKEVYQTERRINELHAKGCLEIKLKAAHVEELHHQIEEVIELRRNFRYHFLKAQSDLIFLTKSSAAELESRFRKYVNDWRKSAILLIEKTRLHNLSVAKLSHYYSEQLSLKAELCGSLTPADFHVLDKTMSDLQNQYDIITTALRGLKELGAKFQLGVNRDRIILQNLEKEEKNLINRINELINNVMTLRGEEGREEDALDLLQHQKSKLRRKTDITRAPDIKLYIQRQKTLYDLEKEEKVLLRKFKLAKMKLAHLIILTRKRRSIRTEILNDF